MRSALRLPLLGLAFSGSTMAQSAVPSSVTIYGDINVAIHHLNNASAARDSLTTLGDGIIAGSRLGFRGREDLGGGMAAFFTLESGFDISTGLSLQDTPTADYGQVAASPRFWGRQIFMGLSSKAGSVSFGRQYTVAHSYSGRFQPLGQPNSTVHSLFSSHHVARQDNMVRLDSKIGAVEMSASYTFGERAESSSANGAMALGAGYSNEDLSLGAYVQHMKNLAGAETRKIMGLGGNYKINAIVTVYAGAMARRHEVSPQKNRLFTVGANVALTPETTLSAAYYDDKQSGSAALDGSRRMGWVMAAYRFSRRTSVYAIVGSNDVADGYAKPAFMGVKGSQTSFAVGMRQTF